MFSKIQCSCCIVLAAILCYVIWCNYSKFMVEPYQEEINTVAKENDVMRQKYQYQDVNQDDATKNFEDYKKTLKVPEELAAQYKRAFPEDLLPSDKVSKEWERANPSVPGASLEMKNMIAAGSHLGVNTQGSSLKNANQQLRSEFANPIIPVSIWQNSTITPDIYRRQFEIGEDCI